jgi:hypothetical protein
MVCSPTMLSQHSRILYILSYTWYNFVIILSYRWYNKIYIPSICIVLFIIYFLLFTRSRVFLFFFLHGRGRGFERNNVSNHTVHDLLYYSIETSVRFRKGLQQNARGCCIEMESLMIKRLLHRDGKPHDLCNGEVNPGIYLVYTINMLVIFYWRYCHITK